MSAAELSPIRSVEESDETAADITFIEQYIPMAERIASRYIGPDVKENAILGLVEAGAKFDSTTGVPFEAYAYIRIRGAILDAIQKSNVLPRNEYDKVRQLELVEADLAQKLQRSPTAVEISAEAKMTKQELSGLMFMRDAQSLIALDSFASSSVEAGMTKVEMLQDDIQNDQPDDCVSKIAASQLLEFLLGAQLEPNERKIVEMYRSGLDLDQVATKLGVSRRSVIEVKSRALSALRQYYIEKGMSI